MRFQIPLITLAALLTAISNGAAQTVQLPEFRFTTVQTTVSVPNRGGVSLGGISSSSSGRTANGVPILGKLPGVGGLFGNRAIGRSDSAGSFSVHATIIDLKEMDEAILAGAAGRARRVVEGPSPAEIKAGYLSRHVGHRPAAPLQPAPAAPALSLAEIERDNAAAAQQRTGEAWQFFQKGKLAEEAGKANVARIYYQMAGRRADAELKEEIAARLDAIAGQ